MAVYNGPLRSGFLPTEIDRRRQLVDQYRQTQGRVPQLVAKPKGRVDNKPKKTYREKLGEAATDIKDLGLTIGATILNPQLRTETMAGLAEGAIERTGWLGGLAIDPIMNKMETLATGKPSNRSYGEAYGKWGADAMQRGMQTQGYRPAPVSRSLGQELPQAAMSVDPVGAGQEGMEAWKAFKEGRYGSGAMHTGFGIASVFPVLGGGMRLIKGGAKAVDAIDTAGDVARALPDRAALEAATAAATGQIAPAVAGADVPTVVAKRTAKRMVRAGEGQRGMMAVPNLRDVDQAEAIKIARAEPHLIRGEGGQFVGGPRGFKTRKQIQQMRDNFDAQVERGLPGAGWYGEGRKWNEAVAGPVGGHQSRAAQGEALFSAQANPGTNEGFWLDAHNSWLMGKPRAKARTSAQAEKFNAGYDTGQPIQLGKKTGIYGQHLDPTAPHPTTGTNDIWHARAFGFTGAGGKPFDKALSAQEHQFLDYETMLAVDRANRKGLGGRTNWTKDEIKAAMGGSNDWTADEIQAAPWVAGKGEGLAKKAAKSRERKAGEADLAAATTREEKRAARARIKDAKNAAPTQAELDAGYAEAAKGYPDFEAQHTAHATYEQTPSSNIGSLAHISEGSWEDKLRYANEASWTDPETGRDIIYDALQDPERNVPGAFHRTPVPTTGIYTPGPGLPTETGPAMATDVLVGQGAGGSGVKDTSRDMLDWAEGLRAYGDLQGGGGWHSTIANAPKGQMGSLQLPMPGGVDPSQLSAIQQIGAAGPGLPDMSHTPAGLTITSFDTDASPLPSGADLGKMLKGTAKGMKGQTNLAEQYGRLTGSEPTRVKVEGNYLPMYRAEGVDLTKDPESKVTDELLKLAERMESRPKEAVEGSLKFKAKIQANIDRHIANSRPTNAVEQNWHDAILRALTILKEKGSAGLRAARDSGVVLPAVIAAVLGGGGLGLVPGEEDRAAGPQAY